METYGETHLLELRAGHLAHHFQSPVKRESLKVTTH
jgi:hypothetical protein